MGKVFWLEVMTPPTSQYRDDKGSLLELIKYFAGDNMQVDYVGGNRERQLFSVIARDINDIYDLFNKLKNNKHIKVNIYLSGRRRII